jgi:hypothetical protein
MNDLASQLQALGLDATAATLDDLLARATQNRLAPRALIEDIVRGEIAERSRRSLERRRRRSRLGAFKPIADFDWNWPKKIDRPLLERALNLEFLMDGRNLVLSRLLSTGPRRRSSACRTTPAISPIYADGSR